MTSFHEMRSPFTPSVFRLASVQEQRLPDARLSPTTDEPPPATPNKVGYPSIIFETPTDVSSDVVSKIHLPTLL